MKALFLLVSVLIVYGSLYPFSFDPAAPNSDAVARFLDTLHWTGGRGDVLGNIALFLPLGFLGGLLLGDGRRGVVKLIGLTGWVLVLAFGIQVAQLYIPAREAALSDGLWNVLGTVLGLLPGLVAARWSRTGVSEAETAMRGLFSFPAILAGCWVAYRLAPYVPSLDWQSIKDSLKPLLVTHEIGGTSLVRSAAGWMTIAALWHGWRRGRWSDTPVLLMAPAVMLGEVLVIHNAVTLGNAIGAAAGLAVWWTIKNSGLRYAVAAGLLSIAIIWIGLEPFAFGATPVGFHLLPFRGFLGCSMYVNVQQLFLKFFLYGGLIWLLTRAGAGFRSTVAGVALGVLAIEFAQRWLPGRTPEISDALLALMAGWLMHITDVAQADTNLQSESRRPPQRPSAVAAAAAAKPHGHLSATRAARPRKSFLRGSE